ncbi:MAG: hypothetical protein PHQ35_10790 [Phycisphaerae bacterium]|nr:hypothetical protein [Phycisphaerae bacterium]
MAKAKSPIKTGVRRTIYDDGFDKTLVKSSIMTLGDFALPIPETGSDDLFSPVSKESLSEDKIKGVELSPLPITESEPDTFTPKVSEVDSGSIKGEVLPALAIPASESDEFKPSEIKSVDSEKLKGSDLGVATVDEEEIEAQMTAKQEVILPNQGSLDSASEKTTIGTIAENSGELGMASAALSQFSELGRETVLEQSKKTYDCIVDIAGYGDFLYLYDAIKAGATSIFVRDGYYEERGSIIPLANTTIVGESRLGTVINFVSNTITLSSTDVTFRHLTLQSTAITNFITQTASCCFDDVLIDWNTSIASTYAIYSNATSLARITMSNVYFNCPNVATAYGLYINGGSYGILVAHNLFFYGEGANAVAMKIVSSTYNHIISNLYMDGTFSTTDTIMLNITNITNVLGRAIPFELTCLYKCEVSNIYMMGSGANIKLENNYNMLTNVRSSKMGMTASTGYNNQIVNAVIYELTLNAGAYYNSFIDCTYQTVTDNSGKPNEFIRCRPLNTSYNLLPSDYAIQYVKNTSGGELVAGNIVTLKAVAGGNEITTTTT